jgi:hypothetical protein
VCAPAWKSPVAPPTDTHTPHRTACTRNTLSPLAATHSGRCTPPLARRSALGHVRAGGRVAHQHHEPPSRLPAVPPAPRRRGASERTASVTLSTGTAYWLPLPRDTSAIHTWVSSEGRRVRRQCGAGATARCWGGREAVAEAPARVRSAPHHPCSSRMCSTVDSLPHRRRGRAAEAKPRALRCTASGQPGERDRGAGWWRRRMGRGLGVGRGWRGGERHRRRNWRRSSIGGGGQRAGARARAWRRLRTPTTRIQQKCEINPSFHM